MYSRTQGKFEREYFSLDANAHSHIIPDMTTTTPLKYIREHLFGVNQSEFGQIAGASQSVVSRWDWGKVEPTREQLANIRKEAMRRGLSWNDSLFFDVPKKRGRK